MKSKEESLANLRQLRMDEKFLEDMNIFYPGIADEADKETLTGLVNKGIDEFTNVVHSGGDEAYREAIRKGLSYFDESGLYIDTEDRERVGLYFQQMMDAVGVESSGGILNTWLYGFDVG
ncbi:DUF4844 domain-containing protein [Dawidia soli]|uniref:DUF4844 domain-containing protein n=1 Tax=Dawidia soli TaxID=2782352 RepID=A0AAP2GIF4_9BACT|nr:DUF4844 domain-containing protein [Dawidia soli]MBT1687365.1 DUF4844 domain-containing protein [Dawidia soli]